MSSNLVGLWKLFVFETLEVLAPPINAYLQDGFEKLLKLKPAYVTVDNKEDCINICDKALDQLFKNAIHRTLIKFCMPPEISSYLDRSAILKWFELTASENEVVTDKQVLIADFCVNLRNQVRKEYQFLIQEYIVFVDYAVYYLIELLKEGYTTDNLTKVVNSRRINYPTGTFQMRRTFNELLRFLLHENNCVPTRSLVPSTHLKNTKKKGKQTYKKINIKSGKKSERENKTLSKKEDLHEFTYAGYTVVVKLLDPTAGVYMHPSPHF